MKFYECRLKNNYQDSKPNNITPAYTQATQVNRIG